MRTTLAILLLAACGAAGAEPDEAILGKDRGYPVGALPQLTQNPYRVGTWSAMDRVPGIAVHRVQPPPQPRVLARVEAPPAINYRYRNLGYSLDEYLERNRTTGLLVLKDGRIVAERYRYGRTEEARFLSFSMAKSVTSLLVGVALREGAIASLDDKAETYAKELAGTPYGGTSIRHLLRMSSGLTFTERYDGTDDIQRMTRALFTSSEGSAEVLRTIAERHSPPGEKFVYASAETDVLGRVLRGATGRNLAQLTQDWLWQPMGAEREAFWVAGKDGREGAHAFFNASLRDWGRLGLLLARDGEVDGRQVVPREYLLDATDPQRQPPAFRPQRATPFFGYGYQFWLMPLRERTFALQGVYGQGLYVQPGTGIVMVVTSVWEPASGRQDVRPFEERNALWRGVLQSLGGKTD